MTDKYTDALQQSIQITEPDRQESVLRTAHVMAVYPCLGCKPSSIRMMGYRVCGHKEDTVLEAPIR